MYPYSDDERENGTTEAALNRMVEDRLYWQEQDPEFRRYVDNSFKSVYGDNEAEQDATGRTVSPAPRAVTLPPFRPGVTLEDTALSGPVGDAQPNAWRDVLKVQKGLANTNHYAFDMAKERSGEHSPGLAQAIRNFQREKKEEIDGTLLPGGPTITRMKESLFGDNAKSAAFSGNPAIEPNIGITPAKWRLPPATQADAPATAVPVQDKGNEIGKNDSTPVPTTRFTGDQLRYLQGGDMVSHELRPRGRYPRDPYGLDHPNHPYDPTKPAPPAKTIELTEKDVELIAKLVKYEAGLHGELGRQGVLFNILNRMAVGDYFGRRKGGDTRAVAIMNFPGAYEPVRRYGRGDVRNLRVDSQELAGYVAQVKQWISQIQRGELTDPTDGNLYFLNRAESRKRGTDFGNALARGKVVQKWQPDVSGDVEPLMVVGPERFVHHFYNRYTNPEHPERIPAYEYVPPYRVNYPARERAPEAIRKAPGSRPKR